MYLGYGDLILCRHVDSAEKYQYAGRCRRFMIGVFLLARQSLNASEEQDEWLAVRRMKKPARGHADSQEFISCRCNGGAAAIDDGRASVDGA